MNWDIAGVLLVGLRIAAIVQIVVGALTLFLVRLLGWHTEVNRLPPLMRQVFFVHAWFISLTLMIFAVLTWGNVHAMASASNPTARWLAGAIAVFWAIRTTLQVCYYSTEHWRGKRGPTTIHIALLMIYGLMTLVYGLALARP